MMLGYLRVKNEGAAKDHTLLSFELIDADGNTVKELGLHGLKENGEMVVMQVTLPPEMDTPVSGELTVTNSGDIVAGVPTRVFNVETKTAKN